VPAAAHAAVLTVTVTDPMDNGYVTVFPCGATMPLASNVNVSRGETVPNLVTAALGADGRVCIYASIATNLVVDLSGYYDANGVGFAVTSPARVVDTRQGSGQVTAGTVFRVSLAGLAGVPLSGATAVALNITATRPARSGFVSAYPCGQPVPTVSSVNFTAGHDAADAAIVGLGSAGDVCMVPTQAGYVTVYPCDQAVPATSTVNFVAGQTVANAAATSVDSHGSVCVNSSATTHVIIDLDGTSTALRAAASAGTGANAALAWARTQIGAPYAALNPYRFGDSIYGKPWDCPGGAPVCTKVDMHGTARTIEAGAFAYDCSGLVVAAWLRAGVDLVKKNAAWTDTMYTNLPHVSRAQALPGDLVLYGPTSDPTDGTITSHVGLYLDDGHLLESGGGCANDLGVCIGSIDWTRVVAVARPN
jgi:cell wall-associated NlpC family hydrolase